MHLMSLVTLGLNVSALGENSWTGICLFLASKMPQGLVQHLSGLFLTYWRLGGDTNRPYGQVFFFNISIQTAVHSLIEVHCVSVVAQTFCACFQITKHIMNASEFCRHVDTKCDLPSAIILLYPMFKHSDMKQTRFCRQSGYKNHKFHVHVRCWNMLVQKAFVTLDFFC